MGDSALEHSIHIPLRGRYAHVVSTACWLVCWGDHFFSDRSLLEMEYCRFTGFGQLHERGRVSGGATTRPRITQYIEVSSYLICRTRVVRLLSSAQQD